MATPLAVDQVVEARFYNHLGAQQAINTLHYRVTAVSATPPTDQDFADAVALLAAGVYKPYMPSAAVHDGVRVQIIRPTRQNAVINIVNAGVGARAAEPLPPVPTLLLSIRSGTAARAARGRVFLPFWAEDENDATGKPTAGAITLATNWSNALLATLNIVAGATTATLVPVVWSRSLLFAFPSTQVLIRTQWATQKRRSQINKADTFGPTP